MPHFVIFIILPLQWMRGNVVVVAVAAVLGATNVSVLNALGSEVFGVAATCAPFSSETEDLISFGGVASVLFEDVPQARPLLRFVSFRCVALRCVASLRHAAPFLGEEKG